MKLKPLIIDSSKSNFEKDFLKRIRINDATNSKIQSQVNKIISAVKKKGDFSLIGYINKFFSQIFLARAQARAILFLGIFKKECFSKVSKMYR